MSLRSNRILKYIITLIFVFELLAPAFMAKHHEKSAEKTSRTQIVFHEGALDYLAVLLFEENNNEEREDKDFDIDFLFLSDTFNQLAKFQNTTAYKFSEQVRFDSQPSLYTLNRVLRI